MIGATGTCFDGHHLDSQASEPGFSMNAARGGRANRYDLPSRKHPYSQAEAIGGIFSALPAALVLMPLVGGWLWTGMRNVWVFLGQFFIFFR